MKISLSIILVCICITIYGQNKFTISGYIEDAKTGEALINANVYDSKTYQGTITNVYGFFSLTLPEGEINLTISYVGYQIVEKKIELNKNQTLNLQLDPNIELEEVNVYGQSAIEKVRSTQMSTVEVPMKEVKNLPVLLGEVDILKTIQLLPGVQSGNEGTSGIYVRGGAPDQNLILLDGVPVYNVNHLFGFFSVFNADAINNISLVKGGFPARYGGRLSSVIDIRMKEGNMKEFKGTGSVGIISSKLSLEGPIIKDKTSFIVSGRRTYIDILMMPITKSLTEDVTAGYYFYDLNAKINHKFSDRSRLYLSAYNGRDKAYTKFSEDDTYMDEYYEYKIKFNLGWGNITSALRWNYLINDKLFSNTTITYSKYKFFTNFEYDESSNIDQEVTNSNWFYEYFSGIDDIAGKVDFDYFPNTNHAIKFGASNTYHTFRPGVNVFEVENDNAFDIDTTFGNKNIYGNEFCTYFEDDIRITPLLKANLGLHFSTFNVENKNYYSLQPRISARYMLNEKMSVKASYASMTQYILLLSSSTIGLPTDLWLPATKNVKPQKSEQVAVGTSYALNNIWNISLEGYYKNMKNLIEYKPGETFFGADKDWETMIDIGEGTSYGAEFFVQKNVGDLTGWFGYTLSWTNRKGFDEINDGKEYSYRYDRRHDIGIALTYKLSEKIDFSTAWVYGTGNAVTLGLEKYPSVIGIQNGAGMFDDYYNIEYYEERNGYRMAAYHRLDFAVNFHREKLWWDRTITLGVYNAYSRNNPFFLYWQDYFDFQQRNDRKRLMQVSLFPIIPSIRYSFTF